jgi:hypothetical protein
MARQLRMSAELGDWFAELCNSDGASAAEVGAAVTAIMDADDPTSLVLLGPPAAEQVDPREELDYLYQSMLEAFQHVRIEVGDAATTRVGAERLLAELDGDPQPDLAVQAWLRQARDKAKRQEAAVAKRSRRLQDEVDRFRTAKETAKAMYTAAEASLRIQDAVAAAASEGSTAAETIRRYPHPPQAAPMGDDEPAELKRALEAAEAQLQTVATEAYQTLRSVMEEAGLRAGHLRTGPARPVAGLLELHADPLGRDVRLLVALEPADTVTMLAVLDGEDAISEHRSQAIRLAGDLLTDIRAGDWPPEDADEPADTEVTFAQSATFLGRFFSSQADAVAARATELSSARSATALRGSVSMADLSAKTGISEQRLRQIEDGGLRVAEVHEAVAYVRALGGRLTLTAELGDSAPVQLT